ncbi:hypothetical protein [Winogradskyella sp. 3972H.M.0a.05]|uniref:hypothetical protein n=1 Tax=Winogradskyella sp. 3972H.M.0a.05 TaxID=2950277 RepID=UPI003394C42C
MNYKQVLIIVGFIVLGCKNEESKKVLVEKDLTVAERIAKAHGYDNWDNVNRIEFTFKVDREGQSGSGRHWAWEPKNDAITLTTSNDTISYNRKSIDSLSQRADRAFINDKFWLLFPFQLVWDEGITISEPEQVNAPISNELVNKIVLTYGNEGGYTPGDAYDIYYDDNYIIKEWGFREGNAEEASLVNTFETYKDFNGIKIATEHKQKDKDWNLNFADIKVIVE